MNKVIWVVVILAIAGVSYYVWNQIPDTPKSQTLGGYVHTLQNDEMKAKAVASTMNHNSVDDAVRKYKADKGAYPASLQDLVPDYLDHVPGGVQYDPATGAVSGAQ